MEQRVCGDSKNDTSLFEMRGFIGCKKRGRQGGEGGGEPRGGGGSKVEVKSDIHLTWVQHHWWEKAQQSLRR